MTFKSVKVSRSVMFYNEQGKEEWVGIAPIVELTQEESDDFVNSVDRIFKVIDPIVQNRIPIDPYTNAVKKVVERKDTIETLKQEFNVTTK